MAMTMLQGMFGDPTRYRSKPKEPPKGWCMHCDAHTVLDGLFCSDKCKEEHRADPEAYERGEKKLKKRIKELRRQDYIETQREIQKQKEEDNA